jgi:sugar-specific transcriptional regulator TrmB
MTRKPHRAINQVDTRQYILKADHVKEIAERENRHILDLLEEKEKQLIESRRLIEEQMRGYPEIFLTKAEYEKQHQGVVEDLKRIVAISATHITRETFEPFATAVTKLVDSKDVSKNTISWSISVTAIVVTAIIGLAHILWGKIP